MSPPLFFTGLHQPSDAHLFERSFISVNRLGQRKSDFAVNDWVMDSGAFTRLNTCICGHGLEWKQSHIRGTACHRCDCRAFQAKGHLPVERYAELVNRWSNCGNLLAAVAQDYMCEPVVLHNTGLRVEHHQQLTIGRYDDLKRLVQNVYIMPVLQGYEPWEYVRHIVEYGDRLKANMWVGVGSVCKRNASPWSVYEVVRAIKDVRPDLRLHLFGAKKLAMAHQGVRELTYSHDSMAWSDEGRKAQWHGGRSTANDPMAAMKYTKDLAKQPVQLMLR